MGLGQVGVEYITAPSVKNPRWYNRHGLISIAIILQHETTYHNKAQPVHMPRQAGQMYHTLYTTLQCIVCTTLPNAIYIILYTILHQKQTGYYTMHYTTSKEVQNTCVGQDDAIPIGKT